MTRFKSFSTLGLLAFVFVTSAAYASEPLDGDREPQSARALSKDDQRILERGEISDSRYVSSGIVGSIVGFGIGHAMEHRYRERGWIFTAGESTGAGILIAAESFRCVGDHEDGVECESPSNGLVITGAAILGVFKIWEIIDLWTAPPRENERYRELTRHRTQRHAFGLEDLKVVPLLTAHNTPELGLSADF